MQAKYTPGTKENKEEIERIIAGFGGRFGDRMGPAKLVNRVALISEDSSDLKKEINDVKHSQPKNGKASKRF